MRKITRIVCLFFAVLTVLLCFPFTVLAGTANPMHSTYVCDDLEAMGYDLSDYPLDTSADFITIIDFTEYGYDYYGDFRYYGLYFYIYNPSGKPILNGSNYVEMAYKDSTGMVTSYLKYSLERLSCSTDDGNAHTLYKLYVPTSRSIAKNINRGVREYYVSSMELQLSDGTGVKPETFVIGGTYKFQGYQENFGINEGDKQTLYRTYEQLDVVETELHAASWFSATSDLGEDYRYEVSSVYFNIPDYFIEKYGDISDEPKDGGTSGLYSVQGEYYKYVTDGLLMTDSEFYEKYKLYDYAGVHLSTQSSWADSTIGSGSVGFYKVGTSYSDAIVKSVWYDLSYNMFIGSKSLGSYTFNSNDINSHICNVLLSDLSEIAYVSQKSFLEQYNAQGRNYYGDTGGLSERNADTFTGLGHQLYDISVDDQNLNSAIKSFASTKKDGVGKFLHKLFNKELYVDEEGYAEIKPIVEIYDDSFKVGDGGDNDISEKLFIMSDDVAPLEAFYDEMSDGNHVYLMRFDVNPYYCPEVTITTDPVYGVFSSDAENYTGYYFEKAIYHDFDILSFTFKDAGSGFKTVPVSCQPIDIVGAVIPGNNTIQPNPNDPTGRGANGLLDENPFLKVIAILLVVIIVILGVWLIVKFFSSAFVGVSDAKERRYRYYTTEKQMQADKQSAKSEKRAARESKRAEKARKRAERNKVKKPYDSPTATVYKHKIYKPPVADILRGEPEKKKRKKK